MCDTGKLLKEAKRHVFKSRKKTMLLFFLKKEQKSAFINFYKGNKLQKMKQRIFLCNQYFHSLLKVNCLLKISFWNIDTFEYNGHRKSSSIKNKFMQLHTIQIRMVCHNSSKSNWIYCVPIDANMLMSQKKTFVFSTRAGLL